MKQSIGILDAELLFSKTRQPNLSCLKLSGYYKQQGATVTLLEKPADVLHCKTVFLAKVFPETVVPKELLSLPHLRYGGSGFPASDDPRYLPALPDAIEHTMPDYHLYDTYIGHQIAQGARINAFKDYYDASIGRMTKDGAFHAHVKEFLDPSRKRIYLLDDNVFAYKGWQDVFSELAETKKAFQFRQGLDIRLLTDEKAAVLAKARYYGSYTFSFDRLEDRQAVADGLDLLRRYTNACARVFVPVGRPGQDVLATFQRIQLLMEYRALPFILRAPEYATSKERGMFINLGRWCNQPAIFKKKTFREFCELIGPDSATMRYMQEYEREHPEIAKRYYDMRFETLSQGR